MPELSYREAVRDALSRAMRDDDDVFIMGEDMNASPGAAGDDRWLDAFKPYAQREA